MTGHRPQHLQPYSRFRPATVAIPPGEYQRRAAELLGELGRTDEGRMVYAIVTWARHQVDAENAGRGT